MSALWRVLGSGPPGMSSRPCDDLGQLDRTQGREVGVPSPSRTPRPPRFLLRNSSPFFEASIYWRLVFSARRLPAAISEICSTQISGSTNRRIQNGFSAVDLA